MEDKEREKLLEAIEVSHYVMEKFRDIGDFSREIKTCRKILEKYGKLSEFYVGREVELKRGQTMLCPPGRENNKTAKILRFLVGIDGGAVLDRDLHGCKFWNIDALSVVD